MKYHYLISIFLVLSIFLYSQPIYEFHLRDDIHTDYYSKTITSDQPTPIGNAITDLIWSKQLYMGTSRGISILDSTLTDWTHYDKTNFNGRSGITALALQDSGVIWLATGFDTLAGDENLSAGGGLFYLHPDSVKWHWIPQPVDPRSDYDSTIIALPTTTNIQNVTYDIAFYNDEIWIASWGGGVRRSSDFGSTWIPFTVDQRRQDVRTNEIHRGFSLLSENDNLWIGTAGGIGKVNGQDTLVFEFSQAGNSISGNWVIDIAYQQSTGWVWATTLRALAQEEYNAISASPDGGLTWYNFLTDELSDGTFPRDIGFAGDTVFVATEKGMYFSYDLGFSWNKVGLIVDETTGDKILNDVFYSVTSELLASGYRHWFGSSQGLVSTENLLDFKIFRRFVRHSEREKPETFAYPSPFSPRRSQYARIQFYLTDNSYVEATIFSYAMEKVIQLSDNISGITPDTGDRYLVWDGKDAQNNYVANGVYFYKLKIGNKISWGKIVVLN